VALPIGWSTGPMRTRLCAPLLLSLLLATACSAGSGDPDVASAAGTPSPHTTPTTSRFDQFVAYAQCMREHGVPMSDPQQDGDRVLRPRVDPGFDKGEADAAEEKCKSLQPPQETGPEMDQKIELARRFAVCMRAHGVENYPDPDADGRTRVSDEVGNDPQNPDARDACDAETAKQLASLRPSS